MADEPRPDALQAEADRLDTAISAALAGRPVAPTDPTASAVLWLAAAARPTPPSSLDRVVARRVERAEARRWRPTQLAAAVLATLLFAQGFGGLVWGEWVARGLDEPYSHHTYLEGGLVLIALAIVIAAGFVDRRALPASVAGGTPIGVALGLNGLTEIGQFGAGFLLHSLEGITAIALLVLWWRARRYGTHGTDEGGA